LTLTSPAYANTAERPPRWYLDPVVARQKRDLHQCLIRRWSAGRRPERVLKTDLFEESHGGDDLLFDLFETAPFLAGLDVCSETVALASRRCQDPQAGFFQGDVRNLPLACGSFDLIVSTSTLDHFEAAAEFERALAELARVLRPGGSLIVTVDNPWNPTYWPLRWLSGRRGAPFRLGYTPSLARLAGLCRSAGLEVEARDALIHNPRVASTALFLLLRRLLGKKADAPIGWSLALWETLDRLPTRFLTACFVAVCARKPQSWAGRGAG